jgi:hypothetical protein
MYLSELHEYKCMYNYSSLSARFYNPNSHTLKLGEREKGLVGGSHGKPTVLQTIVMSKQQWSAITQTLKLSILKTVRLLILREN